jgi:hypothetical protein
MQKQVLVRQGVYAGEQITDKLLPLVRKPSLGNRGWFVTVHGAEFGVDRNIRIYLEDPADCEIVGEEVSQAKPAETDEQAMERIRKRFAILDQMTDAVANSVVRGLIIAGPPGVGKSFGVEKILEEYDAMGKLSGDGVRTEVVKGSMTPIGLYQTLFQNSDPGNILVFDDCDSILFDEVCLNMLKAVLDSGKKRMISWKSESRALKAEGIPDRFEFKGGIIFITNLSFDNVRSKKIQDHLNALQSRCHYIDLEMDSINDRFLRIEQIVRDGMLEEYRFGQQGEREVIDFMRNNSKRLREISLRMTIKISDLRKMSPDNWQELSKATCMKRIGAC